MPTSSPMPRQRSRSELERICKKWNDEYPVGKYVRVRRDDGSQLITKTRSEAWVLSGHTAVIMVEQITGAYLLDRVTPIDTVHGGLG